MNTFLVYDGKILLEYLEDLDAYTLYTDAGRGFPYEAYSDVVIEGHEFYLVHLDDKHQVPFSESDIWIEIEDIISFIESYNSITSRGELLMSQLLTLFTDLISRDIIY